MNAPEMLQLLIVGLSAWTLREVYRLARVVERLDQKTKDLPCNTCPQTPNET